MFRFYLKKLIACPATYIAGALLFLTMVLSRDHDFAMPAYHFDCAFAMGVCSWFLPVTAAMPISYIRHALQKGGAGQFPLLHSSPLRYTLSGLAAAFVSGALVLLLATGLFHLYVVLFLKGPVSYEYVLHDGTYFFSRIPHRLYYLVMIGIYAVYAGMFAMVAYGVSGLSANQYICAASGFAFWIALAVFAQSIAHYAPEQYRLAIAAIDPGQCTPGGAMSETRDGGMIYRSVYTLAVGLIFGGDFFLRLKRRLKDG